MNQLKALIVIFAPVWYLDNSFFQEHEKGPQHPVGVAPSAKPLKSTYKKNFQLKFRNKMINELNEFKLKYHRVAQTTDKKYKHVFVINCKYACHVDSYLLLEMIYVLNLTPKIV